MTSKLKVNLINDSGDNNIITSDGSGVITSSKFKIGQIVQTAVTETFSTTSNVPVDITPLNVSITPTSTSSKVLVTVNMTIGVGTGVSYVMGLKRGSTDIARGDEAGNRRRTSSFNTSNISAPSYDTCAISSKLNFRITLICVYVCYYILIYDCKNFT